jgi:hypothetical protein
MLNVTLPVLLTLHVRSNHLESQLEVLINAGVEKLYISIDGPRNLGERNYQAKIMEILKEKQQYFDEFQINLREKNEGLACGMITGIDWFFSKVEFGAIFEDDVVFNLGTIVFFQKSRELLESYPEILMIGGSQPFPSSSEKRSRVALTNYPQIWGWATSARKWHELRSFITSEPDWEQIKPKQLRNFWKVGWRRVEKGYVDTWDLPMAGGMLASNRLCALPPINLTSNLGFDSLSTNTLQKTFPLGLKIENFESISSSEVSFNVQEIQDLNKKFESEIFKVSLKNLASPLIQRFDFYRFRRKKRVPLREKLKK